MRSISTGSVLAVAAVATMAFAPAAHAADKAAAPAQKHAPTIDDVMRFKLIVGVEINPTGKDAVVQVQEYPGGPKWSKDLWRVVPGSAPVRLTTTGKTGGSYTYSPDGTRIAFAGERNGKQGIQVLPLAGGEAQTVLESPVQVDSLRWVGNRIYFTAAVLPKCGADLACTATAMEERAKGTSAMVYTELYHRPWNTWADGTHGALFAVPEAGGKVEPVAGGTFDVPPIPFGGREDYDVAADGTVVYTAKKVPDPHRSTNSDLYLVEGGKERVLTGDNPATDRAPRFSPDGTRIAYLAQAVLGFESDQWRLKMHDRRTGRTVTLAESIPDWIAEFEWTPDGRTIVFAVEEKGYQPLYAVEAREGAKPRRLTEKSVDRMRGIVAGDPRHVWVTRESMVQPPDLYRIDLSKPSSAQRLTDLNREALDTLELPRIEEVWWDGAEEGMGRRARVHAFLMMPAGPPPNGKWPLVIVVHGGPQGAWMNSFHPRWNPMALVGGGYAAVMPNPTGSVGYGQAFTNAVSKDWGGRPYEDLMRLLDVLSARPDIDGTRACAIGGSYGGYMANWMEAQTDRFKCLVSHAGPSFLEVKYGTTDELWFPEWDVGGTPWDNPEAYRHVSPSSYVKNFKTPMLVIHGANDFRVPLEQALFMFTALKSRGVESKLVVFPDEDHFVVKPHNRKFWYDTVNDWLKGHMKP